MSPQYRIDKVTYKAIIINGELKQTEKKAIVKGQPLPESDQDQLKRKVLEITEINNKERKIKTKIHKENEVFELTILILTAG